MAFSITPTIPDRQSQIAPRRALALAAVCAGCLLLAAAWAGRFTASTCAALDRRVVVTTSDVVLLVAHAALTVALSWAVVLMLLSIRAIRAQVDTQALGGHFTLPAGMVGCIATVLLAATLHTASATAAPATFAMSHAQLDARDPAPQPSFSVPGSGDKPNGDLSGGDRSCPTPVPAPGWTATAPARRTAVGAAGAPLITGCSGPHEDESEIVVRRGDSLWSMVARHLHTDDPTIIAAQWPRWYVTNRSVIGPDPDLIHIGQILRIPPMDHTASSRQGEVR